ncbi:MAG: sodium-translocating pyrophosphatase, partial [Cytophagales bacterium]
VEQLICNQQVIGSSPIRGSFCFNLIFYSMATLFIVLSSICYVSMMALIAMGFLSTWLKKQATGTAEMRTIARCIKEGSVSFLKMKYRYIALFVTITGVLLGLLGLYHGQMGYGWSVFNYMVGALLSAVAGFIGMYVATLANVRTAAAARKEMPKAFKISFAGGVVMGLGVVAFALLGCAILLLVSIYGAGAAYQQILNQATLRQVLEVLTGFALGAETVALFARVAGGIYTKAADVGADIVGKIEQGIPEDDPRNPATIADNVGDNVGDIAGMGADLFGSYVSTCLAAMVLAIPYCVRLGSFAWEPLLFPLAIGGLGLFASMLGALFVRIRHEDGSIVKALHLGNLIALLCVALGGYKLVYLLFSDNLCTRLGFVPHFQKYLYTTLIIGLFVGLLMGWLTEYFTGLGYHPVRFIVRQSITGPATNLIAGLSVGMFSLVPPMLLFAGAIACCYRLAGFYGVGMASVAMMSTTAIQLAIDAFGPIADNAGGIAEMSGLPAKVRERTDRLDAVGNTTAAAGKGFAIASAVLTALGLLAAFVAEIKLDRISLCPLLTGLLVGGMVPFLFSALLMNAVGKSAMKMVEEVRRQFKEIPGLFEGKGNPDYQRCISIATKAALQEMFLPALIALVLPILVGCCFGGEFLLTFLIGIVTTGAALALFQCNAGGAWDNAKKTIEQGGEIDGYTMKKGTKLHAAAVVGDTVGDPFKDTSGPAMNILIKLTIIVSLMLAPFLTP